MDEYQEQEQEIDLRKYFSVVYKRRWTILAVFGIVVFATLFYTLRAIPIYMGTSRILIERDAPKFVSVEEMFSASSNASDFYPTQYKIISSKAVAAKVIKTLDLENSREFKSPEDDGLISGIFGGIRKGISSAIGWLSSLLKPADRLPENNEQLAGEYLNNFYGVPPELISNFVNRIEIEPVRDSRLVDVSVMAKNPVMAAKMSNELVKAYISHTLEIKLDAAQDAVKWLSDRIDEERNKVEVAENNLISYKQEHGIITDFTSDVETINAETLANLNSRIVEAEAKRVEAETRYRQALELKNSPEMLDSIQEVQKNETVNQMKTMEMELYNRITELSKKYGQNHPQMLAIRAELEDIKKRKALEIQKVVNALRNDYKLAMAREESLKKALDKEKTETLEMNKKAIQYGVLKRQAESSRQMYEMLIKRFKETSLTEEMKTGNVRVIDQAQVPNSPVKPNKKRNLLLSVVMGLMLGLGLAFFLEYFDNTVKLPEEISEFFDIPFLGAVPAFEEDRKKDKNDKKGTTGTAEKIRPRELMASTFPKSTASESFRGVRTALLFSSAEHAPQVILVTSSGPEEGKTVVASNLAVTMAQAGSSVVIIDCDMRRPRVHRVFGVERDIGLSNFLVGSSAIKDAIIPSGIENLDVIPVGPIPPNPSEILGSNRMSALIDGLRKKYQRIIIDTPPVTAVTDSAVLAQKVDGIVMVIRAGDTPRQIIKAGLTKLKAVNAHILGAVLNGVRAERDGYYYYQYYYYYYYGEDRGKKGRRKK